MNGFIHRDIKAANLLIDDDGTVLLGDLGVAADLAEDTSQILGVSYSKSESSPQSNNGLGNVAAKRVVLFDHTVPVLERPRMGKRKSFVGTVCFLVPSLSLDLFKLVSSALLDGTRVNSRAAVRLLRRYLEFWYYCVGVDARASSQVQRTATTGSTKDVSQSIVLREEKINNHNASVSETNPRSLIVREGLTSTLVRLKMWWIAVWSRTPPNGRAILFRCFLAIKYPPSPTAEDLLQTPFFKASKKKTYLIGAILSMF